MTIAKRILIAAMACIGVVLMIAVGTFLLIDDVTLVSYLVKRLESVSETQISYREDTRVSRTLTPELSINELVIVDVDAAYRLETDSLKVKISLPELMIGRLDISHILLGNTAIHVRNSGGETSTQSPADKPAAVDFSARKLSPKLHDLQVSELSVSIEGKKLKLPSGQISELSMQLQPDNDIPVLSAQVEVEDKKFHITATLPDVYQAYKKQQLPFSLEVKGIAADSSVIGLVDFSQPDTLIQAEIYAHASDLTKIPTSIEALEIPGELTVRAKLDGPISKLPVTDLAASWLGPGKSSLNMNGSIEQVIGLEDVDLKLSGQLEQADWLSPILPESMSALTGAELAAQISSKQSLLNIHGFNLKVMTAEQLELSLAGQFDIANLLSAPETQNMDLKLAFSAPTTRAARALIFEDIPEFGAISASADIRATTGDPSYENIRIQTKDKAGIQVNLTGRIAHFPLSPDRPNKGYALDVRMQATKTSVMAERTGLDFPLDGPLALNYKFEGDTQALQLNQIDLLAGGTDGTHIKANGSIAFGKWDQKDPLDSVDLLLDVQARDTGLVSAMTTQELPPTAYRAKARLHTVAGKHRLDDLRLTTPAGEPVDISETGHVESVIFMPEFSAQGIHIKHSARTDDIASINRLFKLDRKIPSIGPFEWRATFTGTDKKLLIDDYELNIGQEDILLIEAKGRLGYISAGKKWQLEDTDIDINARSTNSQAMASAFGWPIPQLGPFSAQARLNDEDKTLGIDAIRILVGSADNPVLKSTGSFGELYPARKVRIETLLDLEEQNFSVFSDKRKFPELGPMTGKMIISDTSGSLGIDSLQVKSSREDILSLNIDGSFEDFKKPDTLELNCRLKTQDVNPFAALFDLEWPGEGSVQMDMQIKQADKGLMLDADWVSGKAKMDMLLHGDFTSSPPTITGKITADNFFLPDPAQKQREIIAENRAEKQISNAQIATKQEPVFSREPMDLGWMHKANLDLDIDIKSFDREHSEAVSGRFKIDLNSSHLSVKPATLVYPKGQAVLDLQFDGKPGRPHFSFTFSGDNLDPWRGLKVDKYEINSDFDTEGAELDIDIWLAASGKNQHEMVSNAAGDIYITMKHGKISQSKLNLLFVDLVGWVSNQGKQRYTDVNCGIADYKIRRGIMSTNGFFMDTKAITIAGEGTIDLGSERIDYILIPKKKSRIIAKAEPVTIKGPLNDPAIQAIPLKSAALTFGTLIFAPYVFAGMVATGYVTQKLSEGDADTSVCDQYEKSQKVNREKIKEKSRQAIHHAESDNNYDIQLVD